MRTDTPRSAAMRTGSYSFSAVTKTCCSLVSDSHHVVDASPSVVTTCSTPMSAASFTAPISSDVAYLEGELGSRSDAWAQTLVMLKPYLENSFFTSAGLSSRLTVAANLNSLPSKPPYCVFDKAPLRGLFL